MKKTRNHYSAEEKVAILRQHLLDQKPISKLCDELGLRLLPMAEGVLRERGCGLSDEGAQQPLAGAGTHRRHVSTAVTRHSIYDFQYIVSGVGRRAFILVQALRACVICYVQERNSRWIRNIVGRCPLNVMCCLPGTTLLIV
jgi:hypothetical protein